MPALKYAEALGSSLGILTGIHSWAGIQAEDKGRLDAQEVLRVIEHFEEAGNNSIWVTMGAAALRARLRSRGHQHWSPSK